MFTFLGLLVVAGACAAGVYALIKTITFKPVVDRYTYKEMTDEDGNKITVVIDRDEDK